MGLRQFHLSRFGVVLVSWQGATRNATLCLHFNAHGRALQPEQVRNKWAESMSGIFAKGAKDLGCLIEVRC